MNAAVKRCPNDAMTLVGVGLWAIQANRLDEAKSYGEAALTSNPKSLDARILCGSIARLLKDYVGAQRYLEYAHAQSPDNFVASNLLALVLIEQIEAEKWQQALKIAERNVAVYPRTSESLVTLGAVYERLNRSNDADRVLAQALQTGKLSRDGAYYVAKMLERQGRLVDAKRLLAGAAKATEPFTCRQDAQQMIDMLGGALDRGTPPSNTGLSSVRPIKR
jgi:tetratricopeptide (TPR) repeat protein